MKSERQLCWGTRGHYGSGDRYGGPTDWGVRGVHGGLRVAGRAERTETVATLVDTQGVVTEKGEPGVETDDRESAAETDDRESAVETDHGFLSAETDDSESEAETDDGREPRGEYLMVAFMEEDIIFGSKKGYPTEQRPSAFRRE